MTTLPASLRELIESGPLVHLSTTNADGSPQVSVMWIGLEGDDLVSGHLGRSAKVRNAERRPDVALSFLAPAPPDEFMPPYAIVHATATAEHDPEGIFAAWELLDRLMKIYVSPDAAFPAPQSPGTILRYRVDRLGGVGPWVPGSQA